jgi:hypothetical protein
MDSESYAIFNGRGFDKINQSGDRNASLSDGPALQISRSAA